jgi:hypothetical protein
VIEEHAKVRVFNASETHLDCHVVTPVIVVPTRLKALRRPLSLWQVAPEAAAAATADSDQVAPKPNDHPANRHAHRPTNHYARSDMIDRVRNAERPRSVDKGRLSLTGTATFGDKGQRLAKLRAKAPIIVHSHKV